MKKKLLIISSDLEIGGVERSLIGLLAALDYTGCEVDLFLYSHSGELMSCIPAEVNLLPELPAYSRIKKPLIGTTIKAPKIGIARFASKVVGHIKQKLFGIRGDMLVQNCRFCLPFWPRIEGTYDAALSFATPHYCATNRTNSKVTVGWIHSDYQQCAVDQSLELKMWSKLDVIAAVSTSVKESFAQIFPELKEKLTVIENIVCPDVIRREAEEDIADEMAPIQGTYRICSVGRFCHAKNFEAIPAILWNLQKLGIRVRWYLIGFGSGEALIRKKIDESGVNDKVIILGKKTNPYPYIKACDIYVQPSRYEGKAVTVREAQIIGKPVIITNFPTAQSQLEDGVDGMICPSSIEGVAEAIKALIQNPDLRDRFSKSALSRNYGNQAEIEKIYAICD